MLLLLDASRVLVLGSWSGLAFFCACGTLRRLWRVATGGKRDTGFEAAAARLAAFQAENQAEKSLGRLYKDGDAYVLRNFSSWGRGALYGTHLPVGPGGG